MLLINIYKINNYVIGDFEDSRVKLFSKRLVCLCGKEIYKYNIQHIFS